MIMLVLAAPAAAQYEPPGSITVSPVAPPPGELVTVTVTGCGPVGSTVDVSIDGVVVGTATVGPDGSFVIDVLVPALAGAEIDVSANCGNGVLSTSVAVTLPDLAFDDSGDGDTDGSGGQLPRTGSSSSTLLARIGATLVGLGALFVIVAGRRRDDEPAHAA